MPKDSSKDFLRSGNFYNTGSVLISYNRQSLGSDFEEHQVFPYWTLSSGSILMDHNWVLEMPVTVQWIIIIKNRGCFFSHLKQETRAWTLLIHLSNIYWALIISWFENETRLYSKSMFLFSSKFIPFPKIIQGGYMKTEPEFQIS